VHAHEDYPGATPDIGAQRPAPAAADQDAATPDPRPSDPATPGPDETDPATPGLGQTGPATPEPARPGHPGPGQSGPGPPGPGHGGPGQSGSGHPEPGGPDRGRTGRVSERKPITAGRNLPAAVAVGIVLGALVLLTLFTVKATFLAYVGVILIIALWELSRALGTRGIRLPLIPVTIGGAAMYTLAYWFGARAALAAMALSVVGLMAWRLAGGVVGYLRDLTAGIFALAYLPLMAVFMAMTLARNTGARQTLIFIVVTICSDIGGYATGVLIGRHQLARSISPKKTWEGLAGSVAACLAAGAILLPWLLHAHVWQGLVLGAAVAAAAILGDLAASMIKRDLQIKDWGSTLPGHGGILDRLDSLLVVAPVYWLLLTLFIPGR
jgi:phosphatidate cytidylyltransferase